MGILGRRRANQEVARIAATVEGRGAELNRVAQRALDEANSDYIAARAGAGDHGRPDQIDTDYALLQDAIEAAVDECLDSGSYLSGDVEALFSEAYRRHRGAAAVREGASAALDLREPLSEDDVDEAFASATNSCPCGCGRSVAIGSEAAANGVLRLDTVIEVATPMVEDVVASSSLDPQEVQELVDTLGRVHGLRTFLLELIHDGADSSALPSFAGLLDSAEAWAVAMVEMVDEENEIDGQVSDSDGDSSAS